MTRVKLPLVLQSFCLDNKFFLLFFFKTRNLNIMNCQCSTGVGFHLFNEMPLSSNFEDAVSFQTNSKKNALEEQPFFPKNNPPVFLLLF